MKSVPIDGTPTGFEGNISPILPYVVDSVYTNGRVKGLFIGINYSDLGSKLTLNGCINDVALILSTLENINFPLSEACILVDDPSFKGFGGLPSRANIIAHLKWLVHDARYGDVLFLFYSGHGGLSANFSTPCDSSLHEVLIPLDFQSEGCLLDSDLHSIVVAPLPEGVRMTVVADCCCSGSLLGLPYSLTERNTVASRCPLSQGKLLADVVMFSGCNDQQTSLDIGNTTISFDNLNSHGKGCGGGAATNALSYVLLNTKDLSFAEILKEMSRLLKTKGFHQEPQLSSSRLIADNAKFCLFGSL